MTEKEVREKVVSIAQGFLGCKESDGTHRKIIDLYNSHKPIARGYPMQYTDAWCACLVSTVGIQAGYTDIMPTECGCGQMIELYRKLGCWQENDAYRPEPGDVIFYDWEDDGAGDNMGAPNHVGIVVSVTGSTIKVIEGNKNNAVEYRNISVNGKFIRGYGLPNYEKKTTAGTQQGTAGASERRAFIDKIGKMAAADMKKTGILASLTIAQAIFESGWGKSGLTVNANNLFGIKGSYNGASYTCKTQEWDGAKYITITAAFRKYPSWAESVADHSALFLRLDRYANLRGCTDYKKACQYVREDGYATDPKYTEKLIQAIEQYGLTAYDAGAGNGTPAQNAQNGPTSHAKGDRVQFKGGPVYTSANAATAATTKGSSVCKVSQTYSGKHPLHLISEDGKGVYGWVDAVNVAAITNGSAAPAMHVGAKVKYSGRLYANSNGGGAGKSVNGTYTVSRLLNGKKCGVLLNGGLGWVPESACVVIE